jgi:hypothetical protein
MRMQRAAREQSVQRKGRSRMRQLGEGLYRQFIETSGIALDVAVAVQAESQREREIRPYLPLVLAVETKAVHRKCLSADGPEILLVSRIQ